MSQHALVTQGVVFGFAASYALAPALKGSGGDITAHDLYYFILRHLKLRLYGLERCAVFPSHFNDAADLAFGQLGFCFWGFKHFKWFKFCTLEQCLINGSVSSSANGRFSHHLGLFALLKLVYAIAGNGAAITETKLMDIPYTANTATGDQFDILFPLHEQTEDPVKVHQLLTAILHTVDEQIKVLGATSNGDVLQAAAMALSVRARIINAPAQTLESIVNDLVKNNLQACMDAQRKSPTAGHG